MRDRFYANASELKKGDRFRFSRYSGVVVENVDPSTGAVFYRTDEGQVESISLHPDTTVRLLNG